MTLTILASFALSAFLLNLSPGPSILYVMSRSVVNGRIAGVFAAFGLASGSAMWALLTAIGASALIASSELAFTMLRIAGAAYLLYLGISGLRDQPFTVRTERPARVSGLRSYLQGFLVEGTNPKTVTFFLALVPQIIVSLDDPGLLVLIGFCLIVPLTALPIDVTVGVTGGTLASKIARRPRVGRALNYLSSAVLIALASLVLFDR
ncbi:LysE family translocator [Micromonospora sp. NPDC049801]|uniref:LysE family translocator n=1 Tax=unclassified Micromonospora TaxID=2617518 RepID=UPI0033FB5D5C